MTPILSPSVLQGLPLSQQMTVRDMGPGRAVFIGTLHECEAYKAAQPADIRIWLKVF